MGTPFIEFGVEEVCYLEFCDKAGDGDVDEGISWILSAPTLPDSCAELLIDPDYFGTFSSSIFNAAVVAS